MENVRSSGVEVSRTLRASSQSLPAKTLQVCAVLALAVFVAPSATTAQNRSEWLTDGDRSVALPATIKPGSIAVSRTSFEDVIVRAEVECASACDFGIVLNAQRNDIGWSGLFVRVSPEGLALGNVVIALNGSVTSFTPIERQGSGFGRTVSQNGTTGPRRPGPVTSPPVPPAINPQVGSNSLEINVDGDIFSVALNGQRSPTYLIPLEEGRATGPVAIVAQGRQLAIKSVELRDGLVRTSAPPRTERPFISRRLTTTYIAEAATYGDFDKDGILDVSVGPYWFKGPTFERMHEIYLAPPLGPMEVSSSYQAVAFDFTGDGYDDIVQAATPGQPGWLYVNPGRESRRWRKHEIFTGFSSETLVAGDLDRDGKPELVFGQGRRLVIAKPDPTDATRPWNVRPVSPAGWTMSAHGNGIGDIDGDGRGDLLVSNGWWQHPSEGISGSWKFHPYAFGNQVKGDTAGATSQMHVFDVDGDGRNDVVTALEAHGWGIGWFQQTRNASGEISFQRHEIMGVGPSSDKNEVFSQPHALAVGDIDGDGLTDIVSGKRWWAHRDGPKDPDPNGPAVLYWFKLSRDGKGRAHFEPRLIDNDSGVGTSIAVKDLNGDGRAEVLTANRKGAFVFLNRPR